jgi:integrase
MSKLPEDLAGIEKRLSQLAAERKRLLEARRALQPPASGPTVTMKRRRLTDLAIKAIKRPEAGRVQIPDAAVGGLWLRTSDTGSKSWSLIYRTPGDPRTKRLTLGKWPGIGCGEARRLARDALVAVAQGKDPAREKQEKRHANGDLIEQVAVEFIARAYRVRRLQSTPEVEAMLRNHVLPHLAGRRIGSVSKHELLMVVDAVSDKGMPRAANKIVQLLKQLFRWSKSRGLITGEDPAAGLEKPHAERSRDRVLDDRELTAVWTAAERLDWPWTQYIKLLVLLGQRRTEVAAMKWSDLDLTARVWHLPAQQTKMARARTLPLPGAVVAMLEAMPRFEGFVFGRKLTGFDRMKKELDTISGVNGYVLHDLRRTFATGQQKLGTRLEVTEQLLGHLSGSRSGVVGVYQRHDFAAEQRVALERWAEHVQRLVGGAPATIVQLPVREG